MNLAIECLSISPLTQTTVTDLCRSYGKHGAVVNLCLSHERLRSELTGCEETLGHTQSEVASVLVMLDELAELWGDEGNLGACRDRLRKLTAGAKP